MKEAWFEQVDVSEQQILLYDKRVLEILLMDRTTGNNILWGTDDYCRSENDIEYAHNSQIKIELITADHDGIIKPRVLKSRDTRKARSKNKAEVFTPAWICNAQNNLVDEAWANVPLQDFKGNSPIDWTKSISEIDEKLFAYYDLSETERNFIKSTIKEMQ